MQSRQAACRRTPGVNVHFVLHQYVSRTRLMATVYQTHFEDDGRVVASRLWSSLCGKMVPDDLVCPSMSQLASPYSGLGMVERCHVDTSAATPDIYSLISCHHGRPNSSIWDIEILVLCNDRTSGLRRAERCPTFQTIGDRLATLPEIDDMHRSSHYVGAIFRDGSINGNAWFVFSAIDDESMLGCHNAL